VCCGLFGFPDAHSTEQYFDVFLDAGIWCFQLRALSASRVAAAPFARLSAQQHTTAQELFSLSRCV
jgi:hypothetical protein